MTENTPPVTTAGSSPWPSTRTLWDVIESGDDAAALHYLCEKYRRPIRHCFQRQGKSEEQARDLTQRFLAVQLEKGRVTMKRRAGSRFRFWLVACLKRFLIDDARWAHAGVRDEDRTVEWTEHVDPAAPSLEPSEALDAPLALAIHEEALETVRRAWRAKGWEERFAVLSEYLLDIEETLPLKKAAAVLGISDVNARQRLLELRETYLDAFGAEVTPLVGKDAASHQEEVRYLMSLLPAVLR